MNWFDLEQSEKSIRILAVQMIQSVFCLMFSNIVYIAYDRILSLIEIQRNNL